MKPAVVFVSADYEEKVKAACASESTAGPSSVPVLLQLQPYWPARVPEAPLIRPPTRAKTDLAAVLFTR
jgi:hypothetical protein